MNQNARTPMRRWICLLLPLLVLFHVVNNLIVLTRDKTPFLWDGGDYFLASLKYYDLFTRPGIDFIQRFNEVSPYRPPLFMLISTPFYFLFGRFPEVAVMSTIVFLVILVFSVYGIGKALMSEEAGLLAAFIVSILPIVFALTRSYWADFPLTAMVSLSVYFLIRTRSFTDRRHTFLFGVSAGLGMLTKWTWFIFLAGPFLYTVAAAVKEGRKNGNPLKSAVWSVLIGAAVASFWYIPNGLSVAGKLMDLAFGIQGGGEATRFQALGETIGPSGIFTVKSLTYYAGILVNYQASFFFTLLVVVFTLVALKRLDRDTLWMLLLWIAIPVVFFTLIKNKTFRNTVPMLPAAALLISLGVMKIRAAGARRVLIMVIILVGLVQYAASSYGASYLPRKLALGTPIGDVIFFQQHENQPYAIYRAQTEDWKADKIIETINLHARKRDDVRIVLVPRDAFTWMTLEYTSYLKGLPFKFIVASLEPESVESADFVLVKKGGFMGMWFLMENIHRSLRLLDQTAGDFTLLAEVELPENNAFLTVYDRASPGGKNPSGLVFSGKVQLVEHSVSVSEGPLGETFNVDVTLKPLVAMDDDMALVFNGMDKKLKVIMKQPVTIEPSMAKWLPNKERTLSVSISVPRKTAENLFTLNMGLIDRSRKESLTYRPQYLLYQRETRASESRDSMGEQ